MRNLKRALSLTLASVMLLGMMVVGSSAAGYPDVSEEENIEAIEVLQAVGVMGGDENGNFNPDDYVTREQMAVIMAQLLKLDYNYYKGTNPFSDVPEWAAPYVAACAANGVTAGIGGGLYGSKQNIQAVQAALMMLKALGYFQYAGDYGDSYVLATVKQGTEVGLFDGIDSNADSPLTRNQVAQMALNALQADMVSFTGDPGITYTGSNGESWVGGYKPEYTPRTSTQSKYQAIERRSSDVSGDANHRGQYYIQLGEELYDGKLRLNDGAIDDFGRPSRYWEYDGKPIGTYMKKELIKAAYTNEVTGKDLYDLLGSDTVRDYDFDITIDGVTVGEKTGVTENDKILEDNAKSYFDETYMTKTYKSGVGQTGKGVLTQVFVDPDEGQNGTVWVAVINTYLAKAASDYNEKKDEAKLDVYGLTKTASTADKDTIWYKEPQKCSAKDQESKSLSVAAEDFRIAEDIKADDFFLVTVANGDIQSIVEPEVISAATLNEFSKDSYVVGDQKYEYNTTIEYDPDTLENYTSKGNGNQELKNTEYNLYLDAYGYLIGVEIIEAVNNYIFLTGIDQGTSNLKNKTSEAAGILVDGTFVEFKMNMNDSKAWGPNHLANAAGQDGTQLLAAGETSFTGHPLWNTWCTYTVDKDGTYTLKEVRNKIDTDNGVKLAQNHDTDYMDKTIDHKHVSLRANAADTFNYVYGNDKTVYIVPELSAVATDTELKQWSVNVPKYASNNNAEDTAAPTTGDRAVKANVGIISGVESVTVGIDNVDLQTWTLAQIQSQDDNKLSAVDNVLPGNVYTLYNKDGYVIAAVVLGEDNGTTKNLVYSHKSSIESEKYSEANEEWTWTRKVIKDGQEILLTQTGDKLKDDNIYDMTANTWYEVYLKADGTVKNVKHAYYTERGKNEGTTPAAAHALEITTSNNKNDAHDFVDNIEWIENATAESGKTTVLYEEVWENLTKAPSLKESTLFVNTATQKGFYINKNNIRTVLIQTNNDDETTTYYDTYGELEDVLKELNEIDGEYNFKISAIMTDGRATVVIIHDWNETHGEKGQKPETTGTYTSAEKAAGATPVADMAMDKAEISDDMRLKVPALYMGKNVREQLEEILENMGYTVTESSYRTDTGVMEYTFKIKKGDKTMEVKCDIDPTSGGDVAAEYYLVDNNGTKTFQKATDTVTVTRGANDKGTGYAVTANGTTTYVAYGSPDKTQALSAYDTKIEKGYVEVDIGGTKYAAKFDTDYTTPAKGGSDHGTGYTYATGTKYVAYGGTIPKADVQGNITLTKDQVKVTFTGFATEASNKVEYKAYSAGSITVPAKNGDAGTGAKITGISGTTYANYDDTSLTANENDITIEAGYTEVTVAPTVDKSGASTGVSSASLTAAAEASMTGCVKAGTAAKYKVTITVGTAATDAEVNVVADAPSGATVTPNKMPVTAEDGTFTVTVDLAETATASAVTITLKVTD